MAKTCRWVVIYDGRIWTTYKIDLCYRQRCDSDVSYILISELNECISEPCLNGGSCHDLIGEYQCDCVEGYIGQRCQLGKWWIAIPEGLNTSDQVSGWQVSPNKLGSYGDNWGGKALQILKRWGSFVDKIGN